MERFIRTMERLFSNSYVRCSKGFPGPCVFRPALFLGSSVHIGSRRGGTSLKGHIVRGLGRMGLCLPTAYRLRYPTYASCFRRVGRYAIRSNSKLGASSCHQLVHRFLVGNVGQVGVFTKKGPGGGDCIERLLPSVRGSGMSIRLCLSGAFLYDRCRRLIRRAGYILRILIRTRNFNGRLARSVRGFPCSEIG